MFKGQDPQVCVILLLAIFRKITTKYSIIGHQAKCWHFEGCTSKENKNICYSMGMKHKYEVSKPNLFSTGSS